MSDYTKADRIEHLARIQQLLNDALLKDVEAMRKVQEIRLTPITLLITSVGTVAAIFGAAAALLKWLS
jgi:hypothetical protein